ncbi:IS3 family transposase [Streptomyces sp. NPDC012616]|uniref:IS3 family transposase n=1 Tax=Streptomyces sp. NPDC012616 TaxID=3364840 RepID=UPI0036DFC746
MFFGDRPSPDEAEQVIDHLRANGLGVDPVCRVLELSPSTSTYFARKKRPKSARRLRDEQLMPVIEDIHAESGGTYGARRITRALRREGVEVARCTVERLMVELGLEGVVRGRRRRTTSPEPSAPRPPDLVDRNFTAARPDQLWVADMTYVRTWSGWAYGVRAGRVLADDRRLAGTPTTCGPNCPWTRWRWRYGAPENQEGLRPHSLQRRGVAICVDSLHRPVGRHRRRSPEALPLEPPSGGSAPGPPGAFGPTPPTADSAGQDVELLHSAMRQVRGRWRQMTLFSAVPSRAHSACRFLPHASRSRST